MASTLLVRGMLVGILAGLLAFGFATVFGEPQVDRAIIFETQMDQAKAQETAKTAHESAHGMKMSKAEAAEPELVSRGVQSTIGLLTAVVVYGAAFGGLFALAFAFIYGRVGTVGPRATSALLALAGLVAIYVVPNLKYPANPPAVGEPETIGYRTAMFFVMIAISIAAMILAVTIRQNLVARYGGWNASLIAMAAFVILIVIAQLFLPNINEVPTHFPAAVLWEFRIASLGMQVVMWTTIGLVFGALTEGDVVNRRNVSKTNVQ
jgi:predicted cobalt transporter CbtA